jgi:hypothetical protein
MYITVCTSFRASRARADDHLRSNARPEEGRAPLILASGKEKVRLFFSPEGLAAPDF